MTEQIYEETTVLQEVQPNPLHAQSVPLNHWATPAQTLIIGIILCAISWSATPYSLSYLAIIIPICTLTALTQLSLGLIREIDEER
ncbi:hypothetical protein E4H04_05520 [Candidatus Bathyarchaeota archaeon]|jgi:hypothetical protein|nr:MAG: hypothetical protein E4H04_05520 [Candidatus Bathyarchaeota archaeon]